MRTKKPKKGSESEERRESPAPVESDEAKKAEPKLEEDERARADDEGMPPVDDETRPG